MNQSHTGFSPESLRLIGAALALQHVTATAASMTPIPSTGRFVVIGTPAEVARLLEVAPAAQGPTAAPLSAEQLDKLEALARAADTDITAVARFTTTFDPAGVLALIAQARAAGQAEPCVICGADEPRTGTCGSDDARALCNRSTPQATAPQPSVGEQAHIEAAAKAIYRLFDGADAHPWVEGGNSNKQDDARRYARAAIAQGASSAPTCAHSWHDFGQTPDGMNRSYCGKCKAMAITGAEEVIPASTAIERFRAECAEATRALKTYEAPAAQAVEVRELVELLKAIRPNYGAVGSRDVDVTAQRKRIDRAIELLTAPAASVAQAEETEMADRLRRIVLNHPGTTVQVSAKTLAQAADECDRFYNGMMNWKANAQAKDRTIIELREAVASTQHSAKAGGLTPHGADIERMLDAAEQDPGAKAGAGRGG